MAAIEALQRALGALRRNPVLFLGGLFLGLITLPQTVLQFLEVPLVPTALSVLTFFVTPFFLAGLLGMADEALIGETDLGTLTAVGKDRYVPLLLGNLVQFAIAFVFGVVFVIALLGGAITLGVSTGGSLGSVGTGAMAGIGIVLFLLALAFVIVFFLVQFFAVAIAVDGEGPVSGFTASYRLVRHNVLSTLGYTVIVFAVGILTMLPTTGFILFRTFRTMDVSAAAQAPATGLGFSTGEAAAIGLITLATSMLLTTFQQTYAVAFYRRHAPADADVHDVPADDFDTASYSVE